MTPHENALLHVCLLGCVGGCKGARRQGMLGEAGRGGAASGQPSGRGDGVPAHQENSLIIADLVDIEFLLYCVWLFARLRWRLRGR